MISSEIIREDLFLISLLLGDQEHKDSKDKLILEMCEKCTAVIEELEESVYQLEQRLAQSESERFNDRM